LLGGQSSHIERLTSRKGLPIGISRDCTFEEIEVPLNPTDTILLYSDGVTEAPDLDRELYGETRLHDRFLRDGTLPVAELLQAIRKDVTDHAKRIEPWDDMTAVAVRFLGRTGSD
jgi:phosphoserine phosphatase RsbU/P